MSRTQDSLAGRARAVTTFVPRRLGVLVAALGLCVAGSARADAVEPSASPSAEAPPAAAPAPMNYVTVLVGTTVLYRKNGGSVGGWQRDVSPGIGYGRLVTPKIALELDISPTFAKGDYTTLTLIPGVVWNFSTYVYAAARFLVPVDPELNLGAFPGIGAFYGFSNGIGVSLELNAGSNFGRGNPDLATLLTLGALYSF